MASSPSRRTPMLAKPSRPRQTLVLVLAAIMVAGFAASAAAQQGDNASVLAALRSSLHLTAGQEDAWRAYVAAATPDQVALARRQAADRLIPQLSTPRRIALADAAMTADLADFRRRAAAINAFYARLTPDQQRIFDQKTLPPQQAPQGAAGSERRP